MPEGVSDFLKSVRCPKLADAVVRSIMDNRRLSGAVVHAWLKKHGYVLVKAQER